MWTPKSYVAFASLPLVVACAGAAPEAKLPTEKPEDLARSAWSYIDRDADTRLIVDAVELKKSAYFNAAMDTIPVVLAAQDQVAKDALSPCVEEEIKSAQEFALSANHLDKNAKPSLVASLVTTSTQQHLDECLTEKGEKPFSTDPGKYKGFPHLEVRDFVIVRHGHALVITEKERLEEALDRAPIPSPKLEGGTYVLYEAKESPNPAFGLENIRVRLANAGEKTHLSASATTNSAGLARSMVRQAQGLKKMVVVQLEMGKERYEGQVAQALGLSVEEIREKNLMGHAKSTLESFKIQANENQLSAELSSDTAFATGYVSAVSQYVIRRYITASQALK